VDSQPLLKMKLKHIAAYLPHKLLVGYKAKPTHTYEVFGVLQGINDLQIKSEFTDFVSIAYFVPILKPMRKLTRKELEDAGFDTTEPPIINLLNSVSTNRYLLVMVETPYYLILYLTARHYDIFGLINQGLAVEK